MQIQDLMQIHLTPDAILTRWKQSEAQSRDQNLGDIAAGLQIAEAELMAARVGMGVVRLRPEWNHLLAAIVKLGAVRAVTGNSSVTLETIGCYPVLRQLELCSLAASDGIDLRLSLPFWESAFAVVERIAGGDGLSRSIHFYGKDGKPVHRIFLTPASSVNGFEEIVERFLHPTQSRTQTVDLHFGIPARVSREDVNREIFLERWAGMRDTREFFTLLHDFQLSRQDAFLLGERRFTQRLAPELLYDVLRSFVRRKIPLVMLVGHSACVQIFRGVLKRIADWQSDVTATAAQVQARFRKAAIATAWLVDKPTREGAIRSLELFDRNDLPVASLTGFGGGRFLGPTHWEALLSPLRQPEQVAS